MKSKKHYFDGRNYCGGRLFSGQHNFPCLATDLDIICTPTRQYYILENTLCSDEVEILRDSILLPEKWTVLALSGDDIKFERLDEDNTFRDVYYDSFIKQIPDYCLITVTREWFGRFISNYIYIDGLQVYQEDMLVLGKSTVTTFLYSFGNNTHPLRIVDNFDLPDGVIAQAATVRGKIHWYADDRIEVVDKGEKDAK